MAPTDMPKEPGALLRALRRKQGLKLRELSKLSGLPVSTLSKLENGKMSLTYDKLVRISGGLQVDIGQVLRPVTAEPTAGMLGRRSITRAGAGAELETTVYRHVYPAAELLNKRFHPIFADLHARSIEEFGPMIRHPGEEFTVVLEGSVMFHTELYAPVRLEVGDSVYFDSGAGHAYVAAAPGRCRILSVSSSDEVDVHAAVSSKLIGRESATAPIAAPPPRPVRRAARRGGVASKRRAAGKPKGGAA